MFEGFVIKPKTFVYLIFRIPSIVLNITVWSFFGNDKLAVVSAKVFRGWLSFVWLALVLEVNEDKFNVFFGVLEIGTSWFVVLGKIGVSLLVHILVTTFVVERFKYGCIGFTSDLLSIVVTCTATDNLYVYILYNKRHTLVINCEATFIILLSKAIKYGAR